MSTYPDVLNVQTNQIQHEANKYELEIYEKSKGMRNEYIQLGLNWTQKFKEMYRKKNPQEMNTKEKCT